MTVHPPCSGATISGGGGGAAFSGGPGTHYQPVGNIDPTRSKVFQNQPGLGWLVLDEAKQPSAGILPRPSKNLWLKYFF